MDAPPFARLGIVGFGLVGGSVALAARRRWPAIDVTVCDPAPVTHEAVTQGLVSSVVATPEALATCDLIVIATPVQAVPETLARLSAAGATALVTDTGSTKRVIMHAARSTPLTFVGGHPVTGGDASGLAAARADLFDGRPWLLVSATEGAPDDGRVFEAMLATFVVGLGARPEWTDPVTHDRVMAHVSHAPHVVSTALAAGSGDAMEPGDVWQGILETNADFIAEALGAIAAKLPTSADALTSAPVVRDVMERARALKSTAHTDR